MVLIDKKSAVRIFYYLMAVDDAIEQEELDKLDEIGLEMDPVYFESYKAALFAECEKAVTAADGEELFDIIMEHVDDALLNKAESLDDGIPSRMLVWDMLVMSMADNDYEEIEKRLIAHVTRKCDIQQSIFLEMEQLLKTAIAIDAELDYFNASTLPYSQIKPLVDETEKRKNNITRCVTELIYDEVVVPVEALKVKDDVIDRAKSAYQENVSPLIHKAGEKAGQLFATAKEKSAPAVDNAKKQFGKAFGALKNKMKSVKGEANSEKEGEE